jgi:hypothetical protein
VPANTLLPITQLIFSYIIKIGRHTPATYSTLSLVIHVSVDVLQHEWNRTRPGRES